MFKKLHQLTTSELDIIRYTLAHKSTLNTSTGCMQWDGAISTQYGYPTVWNAFTRSICYAHHAALTVDGRPKPQEPPADGSYRWEAHHSCRFKACINPEHLTWVTNREHSWRTAISGTRAQAGKEETEESSSICPHRRCCCSSWRYRMTICRCGAPPGTARSTRLMPEVIESDDSSLRGLPKGHFASDG
jgi:hypothetical protein